MTPRRFVTVLTVAALGLGGALVVAAPAAAATTWLVTSSADTVTPGTLRYIVDTQIDPAGGDTITFADGLPPIVLGSPLDLRAGVTIDGGDDIVLSRLGSGEYLQLGLWPDATDQDYVLANLTIQGAPGGAGGAFAATFNAAEIPRDVTLRHVTVRDETSSTTPIAHFAYVAGDILIEDSTFTDNVNTAATSVPGVVLFESVAGASNVIRDSTFTRNQSVGASTQSGGAVAFANLLDPAQSILLESVHFAQNTANGWGGALSIQAVLGDVSITGDGDTGRSTFVGNETLAGSGGAFSQDGSDDLTIRDTDFRENVAANEGGAIMSNYIGGAFDLDRVTFDGNAAGQFGGGLRYGNVIEAVSFDHVSFTDNYAGLGGAGFYSVVTGAGTSITDSKFVGNSTSASASRGAGAYFYLADGDLTVTRSTFRGNAGAAGGSGLDITIIGPGATVAIDSSTFAANTAVPGGSPFGLGLGAYTVQGVVAIENSTFAETADADTPAITFISVEDAGRATISHSTIVADGPAVRIFSLEDLDSQVSDTILVSAEPVFDVTAPGLGRVAVSDSLASRVLGSGTTDVVGNQLSTDPHLGPLADNGGPTSTFLPLPGSPAIDAGDPAFVAPPTDDQRGAGHPRVVGGRVDIGAIEAAALLPATGQTISWWLLPVAGVVLLFGIGVVLLTVRRRHARHGGNVRLGV